ncbi:MAG: YgeY family selenium metabolism-linked hydrolase, partial [Bacteroidales bacterium]|nr:YgeY family selenium metabolism-linked hydrolase [Bacteroidales bacterium]
DYTAENLSRLVRIKSLTAHERDVQMELKRQMEEAGFDQVFIDGMGNVIGRIGNGKKILAIDGHMDTVDIGNTANWSFDPLGGEIKDGFVHGRGSVDQKGGPAAFVTAGRILKELRFDKDLTVWFVGSVMEEDCDGLCWKYIIEEDKIVPDAVILTEPTNLNLYRGQRGRMEMQVHFHGRSSHGSAPERGINAIYMASRVALEIEKLNERLSSDEFLGKGSITITEIISRSPSLCAVSDYARLHVDRRLTTGETRETAVREIEELIKGMNANVELPGYLEKAYTGLEYGMEKYYPTWKTPDDHLSVLTGVAAFNKLFGKEPLVDKWTFSTNGIMTCGIFGIPTIGFGPGNEVLAHAPDEKVPVSDLVAASAFYAGYIFEMA